MELQLFDSYGNGWDGASVVLTLNGAEHLLLWIQEL